MLTDEQRQLVTDYAGTPKAFACKYARAFHRLDNEDIESLCNQLLVKAATTWPGRGKFITYLWFVYWKHCRLENNQAQTLEKLYFGGRNGGKTRGTTGFRTSESPEPITVCHEDAVDIKLDYETILQSLDAQTRELVDYKYHQGLSNREIGLKYGLTHQAIHKRLTKLRRSVTNDR